MNTAEHIVNRASLESLLSGTELLRELPGEWRSLEITGLNLDSRRIQAGDLFFACFGRNHDARDYIDHAIEKGAAAVLAEAGGRWQGCESRDGVPVIVMEGLPAMISEIAGRFHGHPGRSMVLTGVTGTNGKTSCTQFLAQALRKMGISSGVIGTIGYGVYPDLADSGYTTPDPIMMQSALAQIHAGGAGHAAVEVSSQGLHQHRVAAVPFHTAVFTNLSRDHLDYHESMKDYGEAKKKLFLTPGLKVAVVNADDSFAPSILNSLSPSVRSLTYSLGNSKADVHTRDLELLPHGYRARLHTPEGEGILSGNLLGRFNISNVLAVIATLISQDTPAGRPRFPEVLQAAGELEPVSGRMEIVGESEGVTAVVDYAHTPDALSSSLAALREHYTGRLWCVFGCGGNRDQGKRPLMAEAAENRADRLVITDDNPRTESADDIVKHILLGLQDKGRAMVERDRATAIARAVSSASPGDVVLVAGKGHETYQDIGGNRMAFSDVAQVRLALQSLRDGKPAPEGEQ